MQDQTAEGALNDLTSSIIDARSKPYLRSTLDSALAQLGHERAEIDRALDGFFTKRTLQ